MGVITITSVSESRKQELQVACLKAGTDMSTVLRDRLPRIIEELNGSRPGPEELSAMLDAAVKRVDRLTRTLGLLSEEDVKRAFARVKAAGNG